MSLRTSRDPHPGDVVQRESGRRPYGSVKAEKAAKLEAAKKTQDVRALALARIAELEERMLAAKEKSSTHAAEPLHTLVASAGTVKEARVISELYISI